MKADVLLLAAGLGTRLKPLTDHTPKPLLKVGGKPLIDYSLELVARSGLGRVIINLHYLGEQIRRHVGSGEQWGLEVEYSEEPVILDTGGAIKNIEFRLEHDELFVINSDTLFAKDFDLLKMYSSHISRTPCPDLTALVRVSPESERFGALFIDDAGALRRFLNVEVPGGSPDLKTVMYGGIQLMGRNVVELMPPAGTVFSSTRRTWVELLQNGGSIQTFSYSGYWNDVGTPERLAQASIDMK